MNGDRQTGGLSVGDSIGLLSLLLTIVFVLIFPSAVVKAVVLMAACIAWILGIKYSHWTHSLGRIARVLWSVVGVVVLLVLGFTALNTQLAQEHKPTLPALFAHLKASALVLAEHRSIQNVSSVIFGSLLTLCLQRIKPRPLLLGRQRVREVLVKGYLDYKLQVETAVQALPKCLAPITKIMKDTGRMAERQTLITQRASSRGTQVQLTVMRRTASKLDHFTRKLSRASKSLENVELKLNEGMKGWFGWLGKQTGTSHVANELCPVINELAESCEGSVRGTDLYSATMREAGTSSADMHAAVQRHLAAMNRIRDANLRIALSFREAVAVLGSSTSDERTT